MSEQALLPQHVCALRSIIENAAGYRDFLRRALPQRSIKLGNVIPPARPYFAASLLEHSDAPLLWITATAQRTEQLYQDLLPLAGQDWQVLIFPEHDGTSGNSAWRLQVLQALHEQGQKRDLSFADPNSSSFQSAYRTVPSRLIVLAPIAALFNPTLNEEHLQKRKLDVRVGDNVDMATLIRILSDEGYERVKLVEKRGDFAVRGGLIDIYPLTGQPARLEFDDDVISEMRIFNIDTQCTVALTDAVTLMPALEDLGGSGNQSYFTDILHRAFPDALVCLEDAELVFQEAGEFFEDWNELKADIWDESGGHEGRMHVEELLRPFRRIDVSTWSCPPGDSAEVYNLPFTALPILEHSIQDLLELLPRWQDDNARTVIISRQANRLKEVFEEADIMNVRCGERTDLTKHPLRGGQIWLLSAYQSEGWELRLEDGCLRLLTDRELTGQRRLRYSVQQENKRRRELSFDDLKVGDYVVHVDYGIGRYEGVFCEAVQGTLRDMLRIRFADGSVSLTVASIDRLQKYTALKDIEPTLSRLTGRKWSQAKSKSLASAHELAEQLLKIAAMREKAQGCSYVIDSPWQRDFETAFPYRETPDQKRAIKDVMTDLHSERPMDRLICGDVGFGKTEVALRAAFAVATSGHQVAVLVPTTVLAQQHYQTFRERMASFPVHIELLSRVKTAKEQKIILERLEKGNVDIVIGTHRLLSRDVHFKNLGLIVVDEEHRFGVTHKERLMDLRSNVDVLAMSATPIPRTLQMSLYGIRGLSLIETPPADRLPIKTFLKRRDNEVIRGSILRELHREGQVFYLHNRISNIELEAKHVQELVPQARIRVAHGQMSPVQLEKIMLDFYDGLFDVLISTTIIENGLDIPNVNTIIIDDAHRFGLAQLYQLRGRVGRSAKQGYCYLLVPARGAIQEEAEARLETLRDFTRLGDGYRIARRDMELRGAGDILGARQSGHVTAVGFELYCQMLREELDRLSGRTDIKKAPSSNDSTKVDRIEVSTNIPNSYIDSSSQKISFYKRIAAADLDELEVIRAEMADRYGKLPIDTANLFDLVKIKRKGTALMILEITVFDGVLSLHMPFAHDMGIRNGLNFAQRTALTEAAPGWKPVWDEKKGKLFFYHLFGIAAGSYEYPPAPILLGRIIAILDVLAGWQKKS